MHTHLNSTVLTGFPFLRTAAHNVRDRHAGHTDGGHRIAQGSKAFLIAQNPDKGIAFFADGCLFQAGGKFQRERRQTAGVYRTVGVNTECRLNWEKVGIGAGKVEDTGTVLSSCLKSPIPIQISFLIKNKECWNFL